jgi:hypothetical protein
MIQIVVRAKKKIKPVRRKRMTIVMEGGMDILEGTLLMFEIRFK